MIKRRNPLRVLSPWLLLIYFVMTTWIGIRILFLSVPSFPKSFPTIPTVIFLILSLILYQGIDRLGHILGGRLSGLRLVMLRLGSRSLIKEQNHFVLRQKAIENYVFPVMMAPSKEKHSYGWTFFLGGPLLVLLVTLLSLKGLTYSFIQNNSLLAAVFLALYLAGLWTFLFHFFPAYIGFSPNDGLHLILTLKDPLNQSSLIELGKFNARLSGGLLHEENQAAEQDSPEQDMPEDDDTQVMHPFRAVFLLRSYEQMILRKEWEEASNVLAVLYEHLDDFSDDLQVYIIQEAIVSLCLSKEEEALSLADELMNPRRKKFFEHSSTAEAARALYFWSLHHGDSEDVSNEYLRSFHSRLRAVPFESVRYSWRMLLPQLSASNDRAGEN